MLKPIPQAAVILFACCARAPENRLETCPGDFGGVLPALLQVVRSISCLSDAESGVMYVQISVVVYMFKYPVRTALAVGLSMAQIGEFAFVLLSVASQLGLLPYQVYMLLMGEPLLVQCIHHGFSRLSILVAT